MSSQLQATSLRLNLEVRGLACQAQVLLAGIATKRAQANARGGSANAAVTIAGKPTCSE